MIPTVQTLKRAFHTTVRVGLVMSTPFGLTPSRYELMTAIKCQRQIWYSQRRLRDLLGIAPSTLTRMIDGLVERGFLLRRRDPEDGRYNQLRITLTGRRALAYTFRTYVKCGYADYVFGRGLTDSIDGTIASVDDREVALGVAQDVLHPINLNFEREAFFEYQSRRQPGPVGHIEIDPTVDLWENDEAPILKLLVAVAKATKGTTALRSLGVRKVAVAQRL
ncbi:MAG: DNA-binding transcriptional regulator, MarR family [Myxococcaceae bacterium]|nr:DNA-binding transcriptional regulator, MarR family [Myxococcaceae bacterium]